MWIGATFGYEKDNTNQKFLILCIFVYLHELVLATQNWLICLCSIELSYVKFMLKLEQSRNATETSDSDVRKNHNE